MTPLQMRLMQLMKETQVMSLDQMVAVMLMSNNKRELQLAMIAYLYKNSKKELTEDQIMRTFLNLKKETKKKKRVK